MSPGLILQMVIFALLAIGILVTVHEYGHYIVAKKLGIKVLRFSVGFGAPIWSKRAGPDQTEYVISRWPLGGYVKMLDERDGNVADSERHRAFNRQPVFNRILVLLAGPFFNFVLAIAFFWLVFVLGVDGVKPVVGYVTPDSPADIAGLQRDDYLINVNGQPVQTWTETHMALLTGVIDGGPLKLSVRDEDNRRREIVFEEIANRKALTEPAALLTGLGFAPWQPDGAALIDGFTEDSPAQRIGLQVGDEFISVDGVGFEGYQMLTRQIHAAPGQELLFGIRRADGREEQISVRLGRTESRAGDIGRIGVIFAAPEGAMEIWQGLRTTRQYGPLEAIGKAGGETWNMSTTMVTMLGKMLIGQVSHKNISGPLNIARFAGYTARQGPTYYIRFLALLSLSLGVLNLLPIPMLDGGQVVYQIAEAVKGSPVSMRTELLGQQVGILLLFVLMMFAFSNDIIDIFG